METNIIVIAFLAALISLLTGAGIAVYSLLESHKAENKLPQTQMGDTSKVAPARADANGVAPPNGVATQPVSPKPRALTTSSPIKFPSISIFAPMSPPAGDSLKALSLVNGYKEY